MISKSGHFQKKVKRYSDDYRAQNFPNSAKLVIQRKPIVLCQEILKTEAVCRCLELKQPGTAVTPAKEETEDSPIIFDKLRWDRKWWYTVRSKRDIALRRALRSENNHAAILKGRSKPKCSKLATSKGPSEWRISKGTIDGHFGLPWSFALILCMMMHGFFPSRVGTGWWRRRALQETVVWSSTSCQKRTEKHHFHMKSRDHMIFQSNLTG